MHCTFKLHIALATPLRRGFDYLWQAPGLSHPDTLPGCRVRVNFNHRDMIGIIIRATPASDDNPKLKMIDELIDQTPVISPNVLQLCCWASEYYQHSLGEVLASALPKALRQGKTNAVEPNEQSPWSSQLIIKQPAYALNQQQQHAINTINASLDHFACYLIEGVTGSGKTEIYLQLIAKVLQQGLQALVLVPEIGLTPQTLERFQQRFNVPIATLHSGLTDKKRAENWWQVHQQQAAIVIGTRSAIFSPLVKPGIIIVDEEHDASFKQQEGFRYSARDLAIKRAQLLNIPVLLGSATPSLESFHNMTVGKYQHIRLSQRAGLAHLPHYELLDIRQQQLIGGLAPALLNAVQQQLDDNNQVLFFLNRRGYAAAIICHSCGHRITCPHCDTYLTLHRQQNIMLCHHCHRRMTHHQQCPECASPNLLSIGIGTEKLEEVLQEQFPNTDILRIDSDNIKSQRALKQHLAIMQHGQRQILIGTQMLAKGHHFPNVTLVAIIDADSGLFSVDFRACENLGQLITQVAGRAGRAEKTGQVIIQTHQPDHPWLQCLINQPYSEFLQKIAKERAATHWPPYAYLALIQASALDQATALQFLHQVKQHLLPLTADVDILGPVPALMAKRANRFRVQLLLRHQQRHILQQFLNHCMPLIEKVKHPRHLRWHIDVDPLDVI